MYVYIHNSNNLSSCIIRDYVIIVIHSANVSLCSRSVLILSKTIKMIYILVQQDYHLQFLNPGAFEKRMN